ncbi:BatD family protein [Segatella copri]|jgi:tetratricopeptide (TPR) repeat protein|uniref:BatD family protein n=1 Tax=Segatella copri TaxID=165179 RepID=UPI0019334EAC|nr:BatD family protein [Segatella copri]MBM0128379.1 tetratricopeptide repeat protein [Segatella copri]
MKKIGWYIILLLMMLGYHVHVDAQHISVSAPSHVAAGENFRVAYTINTSDVEEFRMGGVQDGLEVIAGPYTSSQSSYQMINGHTSSSSSVTITYTLYAAKNGSFTIGASHALVGGKRLSSRPVKIQVSGHAQRTNGAPNMHGQDSYDQPRMRSAGSAISGSDLFIKVSASKKRVHEQEPILLTYKVYTQVDLTQLEGKMPDLKGFHTQEVPLPQQKTFHSETVNGRPYKCVTWSQYVMYPQMTGRLEIPSITFKGIVVQQNRNVDPMEAFFNGGSGYVEVKKDIKAPGITLQVDPLPQRPANFSGGVGKFNISASLDKKEVKAGEPITLRVVVGGIGNLKLLKQPVVNFPKDFDKYDAKVTDKTRLTANGVEGNMVYDFLAVPRNQGSYTIPSVELTYYDTSKNAYKTIKTQPFKVEVEKGDGTSAESEDFASQDKDIHTIKLGKAEQHKADEMFFGSFGYWISLLMPLIAFVVLLIVFRRRAIENADIVKKRSNRAGKIATKRLRLANKLMLQGKQGEFYDEVMRALWGYMSYKLNMPAEKLNRDNIRETLGRHFVDDATIEKFTTALDECEFERYAPGDAAGNMNRTFESAMTAIMDIENAINEARKNQKKHPAGYSFVWLLLAMICFGGTSAKAVTKNNADTEYQKGNYQQAIRDYEEILKNGESAEIYFNLGNAYYRTDNITKAVLNYERARLLSPGDDDINFNLQFARSKTIDKITPQSEMFFVTWYKSLVNFTSVDNWAKTGILCIVMALLLVLLYLFGPQLMLRKIGFFGGLAFFVIFLLSNLFAFQQKQALDNRTGAIIISPSVNIKKTPAKNSADQFVLHEGTRVDIIDKGMTDWRCIRVGDGREGWIETKAIEEI